MNITVIEYIGNETTSIILMPDWHSTKPSIIKRTSEIQGGN